MVNFPDEKLTSVQRNYGDTATVWGWVNPTTVQCVLQAKPA
jgi:hypothetical protein